MRSVAPRQLGHRGVVLAEGLRLHAEHLSPLQLVGRVLELSEPGARFLLDGDDLLVVWSTPRSIDTKRAKGSPLVRYRGALSVVPLAEDELDALLPGVDTVVIVEAGVAKVESLEAFEPFDPSSLLDVSGLVRVQAESLGTPPPVVSAAAPVIDPLALPPIEGAMANAIAETKASIVRRLEGGASPKGERAGRLAAILGTLREIFSRPKSAPGRASSTSAPRASARGAPTAPMGQAPPSWFQRIKDELFGRIAGLALFGRLARFFGARQARYLGDLLQELESGDLDSALRKAIPLADHKQAFPRSAVPALGVPRPRDKLEIHTGRSMARPSAMMLGDDLYSLLRSHYRKAFDRLDREGRYQEAAFVLAELLREDEAAVDYLEKKRQFRLAAELAEGRGLAPGMVVRLWVLAGEWERAVRFARLHRAFAEGIQHLSKAHPEAANALRIRWADDLAESGHFLEAAELLWPLENGKELARRFVQFGMETGGPDAARMLILALELEPGRLAELAPRALGLLDDDRPAHFFTRLALVQSLLDRQQAAGRSELARAAIRSVFRDARFHGGNTSRRLKQLQTITLDPVLGTDLPAPPQWAERGTTRPFELEIPAALRGTSAVVDVARLPSGRYLVALGELGVALHSVEGKRLLHFDLPCTQLVVSDGGHRAITTAPRGWLTRLGRIDLVHQRGHLWGQQPLRNFTRTFDGWRWYVGLDHRLVALDATAPGFVPEWQIANCPPVSIARSAQELSTGVVEGDHLDIMSFSLPNPVLRRRAPMPADTTGPKERRLFLEPSGIVRILDAFDSTSEQHPSTEDPTVIREWRLGRHVNGQLEHVPIHLPPGIVIVQFEVHGGLAILLGLELMGVVVRGFRSNGAQAFKVLLQGASQGNFRVDAGVLTIGDDLGRVTAIAIEHGTIIGRFHVTV